MTGLDNITTYYLLHRHDFGMNDAPAGPCILYAVSCGLSDKDLADRYDLLARRGGKEQEEHEEAEEEGEEEEEGSGSSFRLKAWNQRKHPNLGYEPGEELISKNCRSSRTWNREVHAGREIPLIDQVHRLMLLWKSGDVSKVNEYLDLRGLRRNPLFHQLLQALIELAPAGSEERSLMESISNHVGGKVPIQDGSSFVLIKGKAMKNTIKTLALLKATFNYHPNIQDYLDIFIPLLVTLIKNKKIKDFKDIEYICNEFSYEYGLFIPFHPMLALETA